MVTVGGSKHFERQVDLSETEYEEMDTSWYDYEVRAKPEFLTFSPDSSIKKLTVGDYYRLRIGYTVSASEHAGVGDYTFHVVYTIADYETELAVGVYVVEEIPAPPTETPWFIWPMIFAPGLLFLFAIGYLLYLLIGSATHRFRRY